MPMDIEFLYAMLNNLDELEDKVDEIATSISVNRTTLKQMIEYLEANYIESDIDKETLDGLITFNECGDPEEEEEEADIVVEFYNAIDD